jgi:cell division protein FtsI (penicillin-binding protein 3)/stage V sporulation protein D (sporulation-specific penicillin-binding protein)
MKSDLIVRIRIISGIVFLVAIVLFGRLYFVQIIHGEDFSNDADRQYTKSGQDLYNRGSVILYNKDGSPWSGATLRSGFTLAISPKILKNPEEVYEKLSALIEIDQDTFFLRAGKKDDPYEEIANHLSSTTAQMIKNLDIDGVNLYKDRWRFYPGETLAAQTLGFVGFIGDEFAGRYGLERYYNDVLERNNDGMYINFFAEIFANINSAVFKKGNRSGDVIISIEPSVQLFLEEKIKEVNDKWNSKHTAGVIINPQNGEIYAIGVYPNFNVNEFQKEEDISIFSNPIVESVYEMGSIIKPLTMAAGIDAGAVTATTTYYDTGSIDLNGYTISNFDGKGRGRVPMQEVLSQSLNTGVAFVVGEMGNKRFADYMLSFGVGDETGIDLPNESAGLVSNLNAPRDLEYATASFGQGIAMTPISTVRALSVIANGGKLITPHLAKKIRYTSGLSKTMTFQDERVLKEESAEEITRMLVNVVDDALLGGTVKLDNYSVAAKTGTAQIADSTNGGYYEDRYLHSFFGYFPAYDAEYLVFLYTVEPKEVRYASQTLTHPFIDTVKFLINWYEVAPDR